MLKKKMLMIVIALSVVIFAIAYQAAEAQQGKQREVRNMKITGEVAKAAQGYVIRGKVPAEIFTILNPVPDTLDELVKSAKIVELEVRIVSGDNVEIETIDGKTYQHGEQ